jgi:integrase
LTALKRAMHLAKLHPDDIKMLDEPAARSGWFDRSQIEQLASELPEYFKNVLRFAYITGWRAREILSRKWHDVDFDKGIVRIDVGTTKNDDGREFPITAELRAVLDAQAARCDAIAAKSGVPVEYVFTYDNGSSIGKYSDDGRYISGGQYDNMWRAACKRANLKGKLLHDCRRSAVRNLERAGVSRSAAMKMTGHKTEEIYTRYAIVDAGSMWDAATKLAAFHATEKTAFPMTTGAIDRLAKSAL